MGAMKDHPWTSIPLEIYERHMSSDQVFQTQALDRATHERLSRYPHVRLLMLGIAGGNGLDQVDAAKVEAVYGVDVNADYLEACTSRYPSLQGKLETLHMDIGESSLWSTLPIADLIIADLIIEYIGIPLFTACMSEYRERYRTQPKRSVTLSCITQRNNGVGFVSDTSDTTAFDGLMTIHHDIDENELHSALELVGVERIHVCTYRMPNGKELVRQDFLVL